jgi:hypothetical protein
MKRISTDASNNHTTERCLAVLPLLLLLSGAAYGAVYLWQAAWRDREFIVLPTANWADDRGALVDPEAGAEFLRLSDAVAGKNLLAPGLLKEIRTRYENCVWVKTVTRVARVFPREIAVEFVPRRAVAQAEIDGNFYLFTAEKILLTRQGLAAPRRNLPILRGQFIPPPTAGAIWHDDGLAAALHALQAIENSPLAEKLPVAEIVLKQTPFVDGERQWQRSRPRLEITTHNQIHILWGAAELGLPDEMTAADKLAALAELLKCPPQNRRKISLDVRTPLPGYKRRVVAPWS